MSGTPFFSKGRGLGLNDEKRRRFQGRSTHGSLHHCHHPGLPVGRGENREAAQVMFSDDWCWGWKWWNLWKSRKSIHHFNLRNKNDIVHREQYISTEAVVMQIWHFKTVSWLILPISFPMVSITTKFPQLSQRLSSKHSHWINQPCSVPPFAAPLSFCCGQDSNCGINRISQSEVFPKIRRLQRLHMFSPSFLVSAGPPLGTHSHLAVPESGQIYFVDEA